jgi:arylsulfatase A-like enzyme
MYDSLNRHFLPPYGCQWTHAPNFQRLAERAVTFDTACVGSMPCMPARREIHTGRYNFLHRSWGPLEPFDDSMPELLQKSGVYTHLVTDHYHYWEDGGATYHNRYGSCEFSRGQEFDLWKGEVRDPARAPAIRSERPYEVNRKYMQREKDLPQTRTFEMGLEFLKTNRDADRWFLSIETFDPHEPFYTVEKYKSLYAHAYDGPRFDWPHYSRVKETPEQVEHCRKEYAALVSMCDASLGKVLNFMDRHRMWDDTLLIVTTDHGFMLGEHDWWAKVKMPFYEEISHIPFFVWDPRVGARGGRRSSLIQMIDLAPTLLEFFGVALPPDMRGRSLRETVASDKPVREAGLFGVHGGQVTVTDGRYVYMRGPVAENRPLFEYTLLPTHMRGMFRPEELRAAELSPPLPFTKGCPVLKIPATPTWFKVEDLPTALFDLQADPQQERPLADASVEKRMIEQLTRLMKEHDAPPEQWQRLGLA